jgi:LysR family nitrogen assimilation transcriptional regulator
MDTHRLGYFLRIAEEGSMTQAASMLGVAQPALSRQLRLLEEDLGVKLFRRTHRGMELTEDGEQLRAHTAGPLRQLELALQYAGSPMAHIERGLRLGLTETVAATLATPLLTSLSTAFPKVSFSVTVAPSEKLVEDMLKENLDSAVINSIPDDRLFYSELLVEDLVVVGGPASELHPGQAIEFVDLANYPLVLPISPVGIGTTLTNTALRLEITLRSRFATDSLQISKELIETGQAYGILPQSACRAEIRSGRMRYAPLRGPILSHRVGMAATSQHKLPRGFSIKVGHIIREEFARLTTSSR